MIRRSPTRIEFKLEDLQEYEALRRGQAQTKEPQPGWTQQAPKTKHEAQHARIGYVPQPRET